MTPRLLLVEDDPTTRAFLQAAALPLGMEVDQAASLQQALTLARSSAYSACLLDARLPDGSGIELLERLRQYQPDLPALAHTAATDPAQWQRLRAAGFDRVVSKPLPAAHWQAAIRELLAAHPLPAAACAASPLWDDAAALKVMGGNRKNLGDLRGLFAHELPTQISAIEHAWQQQDDATIKAELHRLRASCGFVGAARLAAAINADPDAHGRLEHILDTARETLAQWPD